MCPKLGALIYKFRLHGDGSVLEGSLRPPSRKVIYYKFKESDQGPLLLTWFNLISTMKHYHVHLVGLLV